MAASSGLIPPFAMKPDKILKSRIMERIEEGCRTPAEILHCVECGSPVFELTVEEVEAYMTELVNEGKVEFRDRGKIGPGLSGVSVQICVPVGEPIGNDFSLNRPRGDENLVAKGE